MKNIHIYTGRVLLPIRKKTLIDLVCDILWPSQIVLNLFFCCFFLLLSFRILIDEDADLLAVNNEGEVPLDLAEEDEMDEYISEVMDEKGKTSNN